jgi:PIN domain nuclease of toxin-antitoxin system
MAVAVIDTHAVIWYLYNDFRLSSRARLFIEGALQNGEQIALSSITFIEMTYLIEKGKIAAESLTIMARELASPEGVFVQMPVELSIARALSRVDVSQIPDMPDRIIAATAVYLNVPLISRDAKIQLSAINTIW